MTGAALASSTVRSSKGVDAGLLAQLNSIIQNQAKPPAVLGTPGPAAAVKQFIGDKRWNPATQTYALQSGGTIRPTKLHFIYESPSHVKQRIVYDHGYALLKSSTSDAVMLYNPWGSNPVADDSADNAPPGTFSLPPDAIAAIFAEISVLK